MIDDGIFDGDYVFVKKTMIAEQGEIVIAMIDNEATCKRYFLDRMRLDSTRDENMEPIFIRREDFRQTMILGKVVGDSKVPSQTDNHLLNFFFLKVLTPFPALDSPRLGDIRARITIFNRTKP